MHPLGEELRRRYEQIGLVQGMNAPALHSHCPRASSCWAGLDASRRPAEEKAGLSLPWIGPRYQPGGLLLVGINMNEHGGLEAWDGLIQDALRDLPTKDRLFASATYGGSMVQQRGGWHAAVVLKHLGTEGFAVGTPLVNWNRKPTRNALVIRAWQHIAATNHIKCSPLGDRSRPTLSMWTHCPPLTFALELEVLGPRVLLMLGTDANLSGLASLGPMEILSTRRGVVRAVLRRHGASLQVVAVTHPAGYGGTSTALVSRLDEALRERPL